MTLEMHTLLLHVGKYIAASLIMTLFYVLVFREKSNYTDTRIYLLSIAIVSVLISQWRIKAFAPLVSIVEIETVPIAVKTTAESIAVLPSIRTHNVTVSPDNTLIEGLSPEKIVIGIYLLVVVILLALLVVQFLKVMMLKRNAQIACEDGYKWVISPKIPTPFSFYKYIFLNTHYNERKLDIIVKHEQCHIKHKHYIDVFLIEIFVRIFWFNPVLWWVRKEVRSVCEFQADKSVLEREQDIYKYQTIILEEVMGQNSYLANGFNNSFTKKRFITMKKNTMLRFAILRRLSVVPMLSLTFILFSFAKGEPQVKHVTKTNTNGTVMAVTTSTDTNMRKNIPIVKTIMVDSNGISEPVHDGFEFSSSNLDNMNETEIKKEIDKAIKLFNSYIPRLQRVSAEKDKKNYSTILTELFNDLDFQLNKQNIGSYGFSSEYLNSINKEDINELTQVLVSAKQNFEKAKQSKIKSEQAVKLLNTMTDLMKTKIVEGAFTDVMEKRLIPMMEQMMTGMTNVAKNYETIVPTQVQNEAIATKIEKLEDKPVNAAAFSENNSIMVNRNIADYRIKPEQFTISNLEYSNKDIECKIANIETKGNQTKVVLAIPVSSNNQCIEIDDMFAIRDKKTNDRYYIRNIVGNIPLNTRVYLPNIVNQVIELTLIFPPLAKFVENIDILNLPNSSKDIEKLTVNSKKFLDIKIEDYRNQKAGKVYR